MDKNRIKMKTKQFNPPPKMKNSVKAVQMFEGYNSFFKEKFNSERVINGKGIQFKFKDYGLPYYAHIISYFKRRGIIRLKEHTRDGMIFSSEVLDENLKVFIPLQVFEEFLEDTAMKNKAYHNKICAANCNTELPFEPTENKILLVAILIISILSLGVSMINLLR